MSHTEYIVDTTSGQLDTYEMIWATGAIIAAAASIYIYVVPYVRGKLRPKTF
jgi:hypothetical protein